MNFIFGKKINIEDNKEKSKETVNEKNILNYSDEKDVLKDIKNANKDN
jgi:hypothetical protein